MTDFLKAWVLMLFWTPELLRTLALDLTGRFYIFRDSADEFMNFLAWLQVNGPDWCRDQTRYFARASDERERRAIVKRSRA